MRVKSICYAIPVMLLLFCATHRMKTTTYFTAFISGMLLVIFLTTTFAFECVGPDEANCLSCHESSDIHGFHFSELDATVQLVVQPLQQQLAANGEHLYVNLNVVDFNKALSSDTGETSLTQDNIDIASNECQVAVRLNSV